MATWGEFSSILQLGVGVGVGLSLFRAPVDIRTSLLARTLDTEIAALRGVGTEFARKKRQNLMMLRLRFFSTRDKLEKLLMPFMVLAVLGAAANLVALIGASTYASTPLGKWQEYFLIFISVIYYIVVGLGLEILARYHLKSIAQELHTIRTSRASSA